MPARESGADSGEEASAGRLPVDTMEVRAESSCDAPKNHAKPERPLRSVVGSWTPRRGGVDDDAVPQMAAVGAEKTARRALALDPGDPGAFHLVAQVMEMEGAHTLPRLGQHVPARGGRSVAGIDRRGTDLSRTEARLRGASFGRWKRLGLWRLWNV